MQKKYNFFKGKMFDNLPGLNRSPHQNLASTDPLRHSDLWRKEKLFTQ